MRDSYYVGVAVAVKVVEGIPRRLEVLQIGDVVCLVVILLGHPMCVDGLAFQTDGPALAGLIHIKHDALSDSSRRGELFGADRAPVSTQDVANLDRLAHKTSGHQHQGHKDMGKA